MHEQARVVITGSGIAGSSVAYHLTKLGWRDIVVLEQGPLIGGTTSHAPGLVGQLRSSVSLTKMLMYSVDLYKRLSLDGRPVSRAAWGLRQNWSAHLRQSACFPCWTFRAWKARSTCPATARLAPPSSPARWRTWPAKAARPSTPTR